MHPIYHSSRLSLCAICVVILVAFFDCSRAFGQLRRDAPDGETSKPDTIEFRAHKADDLPSDNATFGPYEFSGLRVDVDSRDAVTIRSLGISLIAPIKSADGRHEAFVHSSLSGASSGDVVPLINGIYIIKELNELANKITLARLVDEKLLAEVATSPDGIAVPIGHAVHVSVKGTSQDSSIAVIRINGHSTERRNALARVESHNHILIRPGLGEDRRSVRDLAVGDSVQLVDGFELVVRRIVPRDEKRKIVGWVEFTPPRAAEKKNRAKEGEKE